MDSTVRTALSSVENVQTMDGATTSMEAVWTVANLVFREIIAIKVNGVIESLFLII